VIHFQHVDPSTPYWGLSPLKAAARSVDTSTEAIRWNMNSLANRAMPELMFTTEEQLDQESWETLRKRIADAYSGADNGRSIVVTGSGLTAEVINWKPIEMDFVNSMAMYRENICMVYKVPPTMAGLMEKATDSNVENYEASFWRNGMLPFADLVKATLNRGLIPREQRGQLRICYDTSGVKVLQDDRTALVDNYAKLVGNGQPVNAAVKYLGMDLEDVEGGDEAYIPGTLVPLKDAADLANEPAPVVKPMAA
jgi:HK97 family phage portal protein